MSRKSLTARACVLVALIAVAAAVLTNARDSSPQAQESAGVDTAQRSAFQVLSNAAASDLPRELRDAQAVIGKRFALEPRQVRAVAASDGTRLWVLPGNGHICLAADDAEGIGVTCGTTEEARAGKLVLVERSTTGAQDAAFGLAADDVTSAHAVTQSDKRKSAAVRDNVFVIRARGIRSVAAGNGETLKLP